MDQYNVRVGTQTFDGLYQFTTNTLLVETAQAIHGLGSDTIKFYLGSNYPRQYHYALGPNITNLLTLSRDDPSCRSVLNSSFRHIIAWVYPFSNPEAPFLDGNYTPVEQQNDYRELYDLAQYFLTNYNNSGKTFYLGHWEGDGYLNVNNWSTNPSPAVLQAMTAWENNRQKAVDDAKANLSVSNVNVYYYAEANRVRDAMLNGPDNNQRMINKVIPYVTNLDFVSYSSYDAMDLDSTSLYATLDYMKSNLPSAKADAALGQRLWIGEYGWGGWSTEAQEPANRSYIQKLLPWGPRFILFWEIYNNETNRNFCLINSNGAPVASYALHQRFVNLAHLSVAQFKEKNGRLPTDLEFANLLGPTLNQPLPAPIALNIANLPPSGNANSTVLSGCLAQGIYGDDEAAVWVFWGPQDGGTLRSNWQFSRFVGVNTNFNPKVFSTSIAAQTNLFFRFYATNSSGESWAPGSAMLRPLNPNEFGARTKVSFSGLPAPSSLLNFPALVQLGTNVPGFSYKQFASVSGGDLRFTDAGGSMEIPYEIDEWNPQGTSFVWVQVPQLTGTNDFIWAYWGNPLVTNTVAWDAGTTWSPQYLAVWHLREPGFPYSDSARQSTISTGQAPTTAPGRVGRGVLFNGSTHYLDGGRLNLSNAFTISAWVKTDPNATGIQTVCANKAGGWNSDGFGFYVNSYLSADQKLLFESGNGVTGHTAATASNTVTPGVWHLVGAAVDRSAATVRLFVDGADVTQTGDLQPDFNATADVNLGRFTDGNFYYHGSMDEVRFETGPISAEKMLADWLTVAQSGTFATYQATALRPVLLSVSASGSTLFANWAAWGVGQVVYSATNLVWPVSWTALTNLPSLVTGRWQLALPSFEGTRFFRVAPQ